MTFRARLFAALYVSQAWYTAAEYVSPQRALYYRARGIVEFDRVLNLEGWDD